MQRWMPILVSALLVFASPATGQEKSPAPREGAALDAHREAPDIIWEQGQRVSPLFIPSTQLLTPDGELLPDWFKRGGLEQLQRRFDDAQVRQAANPSDPCFPYTPGESLDITASAKTAQATSDPAWLRRIGRTDITLTGHIVKLTPGLDPWTLSPATLVSVRVDSTLRNRGSRRAVAGDVITYLLHTGELAVNRTRLCVTDPKERMPQLGDRIVVGGWVTSERGLHLTNRPAEDVMPISSDDEVTLPEAADQQVVVLPLRRLVQEVRRIR